MIARFFEKLKTDSIQNIKTKQDSLSVPS